MSFFYVYFFAFVTNIETWEINRNNVLLFRYIVWINYLIAVTVMNSLQSIINVLFRVKLCNGFVLRL